MWKGAIFLKEELGQHYRISLSDGFDGQLSSTRKKSQAITFRFNKMKHAEDSKFVFNKKFCAHILYIIYFFTYRLFFISFTVSSHAIWKAHHRQTREYWAAPAVYNYAIFPNTFKVWMWNFVNCMIQSKIIIIMQ